MDVELKNYRFLAYVITSGFFHIRCVIIALDDKIHDKHQVLESHILYNSKVPEGNGTRLFFENIDTSQLIKCSHS